MKQCGGILLAVLLPLQAMAGSQYTAEDVIRYYEAAKAAAGHAESAAISRGMPAGADDAAAGSAPMAIPMTGARAGYRILPGAPQEQRAGYDLLVTFGMESTDLTAQARKNLDAFAEALHSPVLAGLRFVVEGHTDSSGTSAYNLRLSKARAAAVVAYLIGQGIAPDRLVARGYGEAHPRFADPGAPGNRRVEARPLD